MALTYVNESNFWVSSMPSNSTWIRREVERWRKGTRKVNSNSRDRMIFPEPNRREVNIEQI